jgi:hypothetical protein
MSNADIIAWFRAGGECAERGEQCRVMEAASGCNCALAADTITALTARVKELEGVLRDLTGLFAANCLINPNSYATYREARAALSQPKETADE